MPFFCGLLVLLGILRKEKYNLSISLTILHVVDVMICRKKKKVALILLCFLANNGAES